MNEGYVNEADEQGLLPMSHPDKTCATCGRRIEWRKKWEGCWDEVKFCSDACRRSKPVDADRSLEEAIVDLLTKRAAGATICPSEAARAVFPDGWRERIEDARRAARRLVAAGLIEITQGGRVVDPSTAKGPVRLRRKPGSGGKLLCFSTDGPRMAP